MAEPVRMCVGCREHAPKKELIRIVRTPAGEIVADAQGKTPGRGAYICRKTACLAKAKKSRALERALQASLTEADYEKLAAAVDAAHG